MKPPLDPDRIEQAIIQFSDPETADQFRVQTVAETGSTNDDAMDAARRKNSRSGLVIIADQQVIGRGRRGDAWIAPAGSSILMSILLRPESDLHPSLWPRLPHLAGLALAHAIERSVPTLSSRAMVKWPNDLYFDQKKIAGILVESQVGQPDQLPAIVVGLGLNVNTSPTDFPAELQETATSLRENTIDPENPLDRNLIAGAILAEWAALFPDRLHSPHFSTIVRTLRDRSVLMHRRIQLIQNQRTLRGEVVDLGDSGELMLLPDGETNPVSIVTADQIRLLPNSR